ncbi:MAG TPA: hypothetical protein VG758_26545 [Hyphomicrobiaceae bacterium]|nr:hypothetical protein [Hyphomicrobiaceae bacterium]
MSATRRLARAGVLWLVVALAAMAPPAWASETPNDIARFLAGLEPAADSPLAPLARDRAWQQHAKSLNAAWSKLEEERLAKIRAWSTTHLTEPQPVVLYMFSGPDFLYVDAFFQDRSTYVLSGLEPVGQIPAITPALRRSLSPALGGLRASVGSALNYSFFITQQMKSSLASSSLNGVLPVLYLFLARSGKTIHEATLIGVDKDGAVVAPGTRDAAQAVKIVFSGREGKMQTLYYFQTDLSDGGVKRSGFLKFCEQLGRADVFIKSASYLLHSDGFAMVRAFLLERAAAIVQDDSGIPVRYFAAQDWQLRPFGRYLGPIAVFPERYQKGLSEVYRRANPPRLDFGVGYRWRPHESNLMLALRNATEGVAQEAARQK